MKYSKPRPDGKSLSGTAALYMGNKTDFLFVADNGPGESDKKGLIVPKFGKNPENHVAVSMSWDTLGELLLTTQIHYEAWLSAWYAHRLREEPVSKPVAAQQPQFSQNTLAAYQSGELF